MPNPYHDPDNGQFTTASGMGSRQAAVEALKKYRQQQSNPSPSLIVEHESRRLASTVAKPSEDYSVNSEVDGTWLSNGFDATKWDVRTAVDNAIESGYSGPPDLVGYKMTSFLRSKDGRAVIGGELAARAIHSDPTENVLWRGVQSSPTEVGQLTAGNKISMPASSFTPYFDAAKGYASPDIGHWVSGDVPDGARPVIYRLEKGAKVAALDPENADNKMDEVAAFGTFEVTKVDFGIRDTDPIEVSIRQTSLRRLGNA